MSRREYEFADLARYNAERARGLVHTPEWEAKMEAEQALFDAQKRKQAIRDGVIIAGDKP